MNLQFTGREVAQITEGEVFNASNTVVHHIFTDSRQTAQGENALFIALQGPHHNGHDFILELLNRGVGVFVVSEEKFIHQSATFILVENTLTALQQLAAAHREKLKIPIAAVTGSNGKTIVKEWTSRLLATQMPVGKSPKSYNSQVGVPLSLFEVGQEHKAAVIEAGISQPCEMEKLHVIIKPDVGVFTTIGEAHDEFFRSRTHKIAEKCKLFTSCKKVIYNIAEEEVHRELSKVCANEVLISCGIENPAAHFNVVALKKERGRCSATLEFPGGKVPFKIAFDEDIFVMNAVQSFAAAFYLGGDPVQLGAKMHLLRGLEMRLEMKKGIGNSTLINDAYSNDLHSLKLALHFLKQQSGGEKKSLILSDIPQTGLPPEVWVKEVSKFVHNAGVSQFIGVGAVLSAYQNHIQVVEKQFFETTADLLPQIREIDFSRRFVLLKGARNYRFEKLDLALQAKVHHTLLQIDLDALTHNLNAYRKLLQPAQKLMVMVKAAAYGSGIEQTAVLLQHHGVDYLGVAYVDEGIRLRDAGIETPVMVISPETSRFDAAIRYNLEPELYSLNSFKNFIEALKAQPPVKKPYPVHIKWETGMNRLGFDDNDFEELANLIQQHPEVQVKGFLSHLAASDEPHNDDFTQNQIQRFKTAAEKLRRETGQKPILHIANTSAISRFPEAGFDLVRLGLGLYGVTGDVEMKARLKPAMKLTSKIVQIKNLKPGDTVGYCRKERVIDHTRTGTVSVGYADGLRRTLSNRKGRVFLNGKPADIVGNICMDMCMIDLSNHPDAREGDEVEVFGEYQSVEDLARLLDTIPYEILTGVSERVKRVYVN